MTKETSLEEAGRKEWERSPSLRRAALPELHSDAKRTVPACKKARHDHSGTPKGPV